MTPQQIIEIVANEYGCNSSDILCRDRRQLIADARHMAIFIVMRQQGLTVTDLKNIFNRTHSAIIHAVTQVKTLLSYHRPTKAHYINITRQLNQWHQ